MKKIYYRKLVRDKIPQIISRRGSAFKTRTLKTKDFFQELLKKVGEEASGVLNVKNKSELVAELADIIEVIEEIKRQRKITSARITKARKDNRQRKGGFKKRIFLVWSADDGYKTNERTNTR